MVVTHTHTFPMRTHAIFMLFLSNTTRINYLYGLSPIQVFKRALIDSSLANACIYSRRVPAAKDVSIEHVVPKTYLPEYVRNDFKNMYICERNINMTRKRYRFRQEPKSRRKHIAEQGFFIDNLSKNMYVTDETKGIVSRCVLYFAVKYGLVLDNVLDYHTAVKWNHKYKKTPYEIEHDKIVRRMRQRGLR